MMRNTILISVLCIISLQGMESGQRIQNSNRKRMRTLEEQDPKERALRALGPKVEKYIKLYPEDEKSLFLQRYAQWVQIKTYKVLQEEAWKSDDPYLDAIACIPGEESRGYIETGKKNVKTTITEMHWTDKLKAMKYDIEHAVDEDEN